MLSVLEKAKALKEFRALRVSLTSGELKTIEKAKSLKRFRELRVLLGGDNQPVATINENTKPDHAPFLQSIINGEVNVFNDASVLDKLEQIAEQADPDLFSNAVIAAVRQVVEANGYVVID